MAKKDLGTGVKQDRARDNRGRFVKGISGNPNGRPKSDNDLKEMLLHLVPKSVELLGQMLNDPNVGHRDKIKIIEMVFDRVYGKPFQAVDLGELDRSVTVTFTEADMQDYGH